VEFVGNFFLLSGGTLSVLEVVGVLRRFRQWW